MKKFIFNFPYRLCLGLFILLSMMTSSLYGQQTYRLSKAPFYKTFDKKIKLSSNARVAHIPVQIDKMTHEEFYYQGRENVLQPLLSVFNQYLDSLSWSRRITTDFLPAEDAPYLFVGSSESVIAPPSAEMLREEFDKFPPMAMHVEKPGKTWKRNLAQYLETAGAEYTLVLWLGFNEYPKANKGLFKKKVVLGTDYEPEIRFLSVELEPVEVLQISGMLLDKNGDIIRSGAEAFIYEDSPFWVQMFGASTAISDKTLQQSITEIRRDDLAGQPLAWRVAIYNLLYQLTQRPKDFFPN